jgi:hypothetical protein
MAAAAPLPGANMRRRNVMTLCPVALAVGCKKCPIFKVCFVKGIIGDYKKEETKPMPKARHAKSGVKKPK